MERQRQKAARRQEAAARRAATPHHSGGDVDPDIAHIRPGPQPHPWADEFPDDNENENGTDEA